MNKVQKQILRNLLAGEQSIWQVLKEQEGYLAQFMNSLDQLVSRNLVYFRGGELHLTEQGQKQARALGLIPRQEIFCPTCQGRGITAGGFFTQLQANFEDLVKERPAAVSEFDQGYVPPEVTVARVMLMYLRGDLEDQNLLLMGDDDLTSIAAVLTGLPRRIQVLEIDRRLVDFINSTARSMGWSHLEARTYDVREPLPPDLAASFNTAFTDPVETLPGITLFLSRCAQALQGLTASLYFGLTTLEASPQKRYQIQRLLLEMGFVITDLIPRFHNYLLDWKESICKNFPLLKEGPFPLSPPDTTWYTSSLVRAEVVDGPHPQRLGKATLGEGFYFDGEA